VIRVLLAEDQGMMRSALSLLLDLEEDIEVVAQVGTGDQVLAAALDARPDVALLDIEMPGRSGLDVAADLRARLPGCRVLILTTFGRPGYLRRAMESGASGFLIKDGPVEELADAIRKVLAGRQVLDPALAAAALSTGPNPLTDRERDVLRAADGGTTVADIAARLFLSEGTVRNYLSSAIGKTRARNRIEAAEAARANGWLLRRCAIAASRVTSAPGDPTTRVTGGPMVRADGTGLLPAA
jgi:two-component system response regulator DesR